MLPVCVCVWHASPLSLLSAQPTQRRSRCLGRSPCGSLSPILLFAAPRLKRSITVYMNSCCCCCWCCCCCCCCCSDLSGAFVRRQLRLFNISSFLPFFISSLLRFFVSWFPLRLHKNPFIFCFMLFFERWFFFMPMPRWPENLMTWEPEDLRVLAPENEVILPFFKWKYLVCSSFLNVILFRSILSSSPSLSDHQTCPTGGASLGASAAAILSGPETTFSGRVRIPSAEWLSVRLCVRRLRVRLPWWVCLTAPRVSKQTCNLFRSFLLGKESFTSA